MFEFIRNHKRLMQVFLMLLIVPSFAFVGLQGYSSMRDGDNAVAKVGGLSVSQQEWEAGLRDQMARYKQMFGAQFDAKMFDTPEAKQSVMDNLIAQKALAVELTGQRLAVSDQSLQQTILGIGAFKDAEGKFDKDRYQSVLAAQGMTPTMFDARLREDLALQQLTSAIQATAFAPKSVSARIVEISEQEREVQELSFKPADYAAQVVVTPAMLKDYYTKNSAQFEIPEQARIEYVVLSSAAVADQFTISDADIKAFYDKNAAARYTVDEQRRASHILITAKKDAPAAEVAKAKAKAEALLAQVRKTPADFAKLAKENSQDPGSAERGGDLDFFGKGAMVKPFEEAVAKLKPGQISDLVQSEFGFHIIMLTDVKPATVKALAEVKDDIAAEIKKQQASKKYAEMAEQFTNLVYEQADSLKPAADKLKLKIDTAAVTRVPSPTMVATPMLNNEKLLKAVFSDDAIKNKRNTEAVEVAPNTLVAAHIVEYKPAAKRAFEEVQDVIRVRVTQTEAANLAKKAGLAKLAALKATPDAAGFSEARAVSRGKAGGLTEAGVTAVMKADSAKLPAFAGVEAAGGAYTIYRVNKVIAPAAQDPAKQQAEQQQIGNALGQQDMAAYVEYLKQKGKVQILKNPAAIAASAADGKAGDAPGK